MQSSDRNGDDADADAGRQGGDRRQAILDAAGAVFLEMGYERATTLEIARRAHISKRTLYEHFGSKEALLEALVRTTTERMTRPLDLPVPETREAFRAILTAFGTRFLGELLDPLRIRVYRLAATETAPEARTGRLLEESGRNPVLTACARFFGEAETRGLVPAGDAALVQSAFLNILIGPLQVQLILGAIPPPGPEMIAERVRLAVAAVDRMTR